MALALVLIETESVRIGPETSYNKTQWTHVSIPTSSILTRMESFKHEYYSTTLASRMYVANAVALMSKSTLIVAFMSQLPWINYNPSYLAFESVDQIVAL